MKKHEERHGNEQAIRALESSIHAASVILMLGTRLEDYGSANFIGLLIAFICAENLH